MTSHRKLAAILSADVAGYSRLMADDERATLDTLNTFRQLIRERVTRHEGRVVDTPGDALLAEFPSAVEAVDCAAEIQHELDKRNAQLAEHRRMLFRLGINLGDVLEEGGALYGDGVNVAARLQELAEPGGICISGTAFDQVEGKLSLAFKFIGDQQVKNIPKPVRVYQAEFHAVRRAIASRRNVALLTATVALAAVAVVTGVWLLAAHDRTQRDVGPDPVLAVPGGPSIAVLAFENLSGDPKQDFFADGISEDIITRLSRFLNLKVLGRNSTFQYKGKPVDVRQVRRDLGADYVLEGSVRRDEKLVRVTAQLLDARNGSHVWAETYDRELSASAVFGAQDDITNKIASAIADTHGAIALARVKEARGKAPNSLDSYECVLLAYEYQRLVSRESNVAGLSCLKRAVERDPNYAEAWAWLASLYYDGSTFGYITDTSPEEAQKIAETAAQRAIRLDPNNQMARHTLALLRFYRRDVPSGVAEAERALALNPNNTQVLGDLAWRFASAGQWERSVALMEKAIALNPNPPGWTYGLLFMNQYRLGNWKEALPYARKAELPEFFWSYIFLATVNAQLGRTAEAQDAVAKLLALYPDFGKRARQEAESWFYSNPELVESILDGLRKAGLEIPEDRG